MTREYRFIQKFTITSKATFQSPELPPAHVTARLDKRTRTKVLCGFPACRGQIGWFADTWSHPNQSTGDASWEGPWRQFWLLPEFAPYDDHAWRVSNHARGRRPARGQAIKQRRLRNNSVMPAGGTFLQRIMPPLVAQCPMKGCGRLNVVPADLI